ncbi:YdiK family protein [Salipaludibacillus sp. CF4.18]|uniref:YdiK family protein n=1 Tax=Salipaludibacillus sp. CF4.18 TaxID=3373081 RepID=UPI003EE527D8
MTKSPRFFGYIYLFLGTLFLFFAIQSAGETAGWDVWTVILMAFAAIDYMIAFRYFATAARKRQKK